MHGKLGERRQLADERKGAEPDAKANGPERPWLILNVRRDMLPIGFSSTVTALLAGTVAIGIQAGGFSGLLLFVPLALGPLFVSIGLAAGWWRRRRAQAVIAAGTACYALFFTYCYLSAFHWHVDPQSPILLLFVGVYSLPVMIIFWIVAWRRARA